MERSESHARAYATQQTWIVDRVFVCLPFRAAHTLNVCAHGWKSQLPTAYKDGKSEVWPRFPSLGLRPTDGRTRYSIWNGARRDNAARSLHEISSPRRARHATLRLLFAAAGDYYLEGRDLRESRKDLIAIPRCPSA